MLEDAKVAYWTAALLNMVCIVGLGASGVRRVRRGEVAAHRRRMRAAALLVGLFLVSYPVKLALLGREAVQLWPAGYVHALRFHETCVALMVAAGALALLLAWRLELKRQPLDPGPDPERFWRRVRLHRRAGWTALAGAGLGVASAGVVLWGMYARL